MKKIELTRGLFATIDDEDFELISRWKWYALCDRKSGVFYACNRGPRKGNKKRQSLRMHRVILNAPEGLVVDHINGDTLDNRRANLRLATHSQNAANSHKTIKSMVPFRGVSLNEKCTRRPFSACINVRGVKKSLGQFATAEEAANAYDRAAEKYFGDFASLNFYRNEAH